ncbi:MAG: helix-turn-helix domain-containing protein [Clostridia bacterium]|nr:helix-turn-helix domain-containing protein [Clostridia bacterium]
MDYGKKIAYLRKTKGMTQEELGKVLNVTYQAVSKWERGESLPDFETMSQMAKYFQVPLGYFADENEELAETAAAGAVSEAPAEQINPAIDLIGVCTVCGKMLKEEEVGTAQPKIMCKTCLEKAEIANAERQKAVEAEREELRQIKLGKKVDLKLVLSMLAALALYALFAFLCFKFPNGEGLYGLLLFFVPICAFGAVCAAGDFFEDLKEGLRIRKKYSKFHFYEDDEYRRNLSLIIGAIFSAINIGLFLALYFVTKDYLNLIVMAAAGVLSFTFISQYMWGGVVKKIFTAGGFTFSLPGFIFGLDLDSFLFMIVVKVILSVIATVIFLITTAIVAGVAMLVSVVTLIPSVILKTKKDKKA